MLLQVLSGAAMVLGLYLIIMFFLSREDPIINTETTYHLGCYDPNYHNNFSSKIFQKLSRIQQRSRQSTKLNMYQSKVLGSDFEKDVGQVAVNFENYLDHYYRSKSTSDYEIKYYNSLQIARLEYQKCANQAYFNQNNCLIAWQQYQKSLKKIDDMKNDIIKLIETKQKTQVGLSGILLKRPASEDQLEKTYEFKIKEIKVKIDGWEQKIINYKLTKNKIKLQLSSVQLQLQQLRKIYQQCVTNQQLIIYCNSLNKQVKRIQQITPKLTKKQLESRIIKKTIIIDGLKSNINKAKRIHEESQAITQQRTLKHQQEQLKLLQYQIQNFQTFEQSRCAMCSEERIKQLRKNISELQAQQNQLKNKQISFQSELVTIERNLNNQKKKYQQLQQERQLAISSQFCLDQNCKLQQKSSIKQKQRRLNELRKEIIDKQVEVNVLKSNTEDKLNRIKLFLPQIDRLMDCLRKKQYYNELKKQAPSTHKIDSKMNDAKNSVVKILNDFQL